ncbi:hypothetical protein Efla_000413 [Eimeria flavescens]
MEIPGFFYDAQRRRYFPLHSRTQPPTSAINPQPQQQQQQQQQQWQQLQQQQRRREEEKQQEYRQQQQPQQHQAKRRGRHLRFCKIERLRHLQRHQQQRQQQQQQQRQGIPRKRHRELQHHPQHLQQQGSSSRPCCRQQRTAAPSFCRSFQIDSSSSSSSRTRSSGSSSSSSSTSCDAGGRAHRGSPVQQLRRAATCRSRHFAAHQPAAAAAAAAACPPAAAAVTGDATLPRNLLWAIRRMQTSCRTSSTSSSSSSMRWEAASLRTRAHAAALQQLLLPLPVGFAPYLCLAAGTACGPQQQQQDGRCCCSWHLVFSMGGEGGGRLLQVKASATFAGAAAASGAPAAEWHSAAATSEPTAAADPHTVATASPTSPVAALRQPQQQQQQQQQQRELQRHTDGPEDSTRELVRRRDAAEADPHAAGAAAYLAAASDGRLVDLELVGPLTVCCLRSSGSSRGALAVQQQVNGISNSGNSNSNTSSSSRVLWARWDAAADAWACASSLSASAVAAALPLFVLAGRQPAVQLLQPREGHMQLQQVWGAQQRQKRLLPPCCCAAAVAPHAAAAAGFAGVALAGSTAGDLFAVDPRSPIPIRLLQQQTSSSSSSSISCIRVLRLHAGGVMIRRGPGELQLLDLRFVAETPRQADCDKGVAACVLREYRPPQQQASIGSSSGSSSWRWQFACDEKEELLAAPFPPLSSKSKGCFLLFEVSKGDCCREIAAAPPVAAAAADGAPFELFGCCCLLPPAAADFTRASLLEQELSIQPLQQHDFPPILQSPSQQMRICGASSRWYGAAAAAAAAAAAQQQQQRFDCVYTWDCFCSNALRAATQQQQQQQQQTLSACCALLRLGGWPCAGLAGQACVSAAAAAAGEVNGPVFLGASTWGLHLLAAAPPAAS